MHLLLGRMVPPGYDVYFAAVTGAAAALVGLLFVSVTLRLDTVFGPDAKRGRALAGTAFTGLSNAFFLPLGALVPRTNLGAVAVVLAVLALISTARLHLRLGTAKTQLFLLALSMGAFLVQIGEGVRLVVTPNDPGAVSTLAYVLMGALAIALGRAWALLQGKHIEGGVTALTSASSQGTVAAVPGAPPDVTS